MQPSNIINFQLYINDERVHASLYSVRKKKVFDSIFVIFSLSRSITDARTRLLGHVMLDVCFDVDDRVVKSLLKSNSNASQSDMKKMKKNWSYVHLYTHTHTPFHIDKTVGEI